MTAVSSEDNPVLIDVHQHLVPKVFRDLHNSIGITGGAGEELADWSETMALEMMENQGIVYSILSYTTSGMQIDDPVFLRRLARECNEYLAELKRTYPTKFGGFALIPLP